MGPILIFQKNFKKIKFDPRDKNYFFDRPVF